jgi:simple sugar transport system permease protein
MIDLVQLLMHTAELGAPLLLAALGGLLSERAGVINIALEGVMLTAACVTAVVGVATGSAVFGLGAGVGSAVAMSLLHALLTQAFRIDHIVSGMAINVLAGGGTVFLSKSLPALSQERAPTFAIEAYWVAALAATFWIGVYLRRARGGLRLLAVGSDPDKARQMGVSPVQVRHLALVGTGLLAGLGGALILSNAQSYSDNMVAGRGFIALAALILGGWRPWPTLAACALFGLFFALQLNLQGTQILGADIPSDAWKALPYLVTIVALAGFLGRTKPPSGLGRP